MDATVKTITEFLWLGDEGTLSCGAARCRNEDKPGERRWSIMRPPDLAELGVLMAGTGHWTLACHCGDVYWDLKARVLRSRHDAPPTTTQGEQ